MSYYALRKYHSHKYNAKQRNIDFDMTFEDWNHWWLLHGVDKSIPTVGGNTKDKLCMCRYKDIGPYRLDNIYCDTNTNNRLTQKAPFKGKTHTKEARAKLSAAATNRYAAKMN